MKLLTAITFVIFLSLSTKAQTTTQKGCVEGDCLNGAGKYLFSNGDKFNGYWINGVRNDYGRYDWKDGSWYIGDFRNDSITGKGSYHTSKGEIIDGEWKRGMLVGGDSEIAKSHYGLMLMIMRKENVLAPYNK